MNKLENVPISNNYHAARYDTDSEQVLHLWRDDGCGSYDIRQPKPEYAKANNENENIYEYEFSAVYKIMPRYPYNPLEDSDPFSMCLVNCKNGNMIEHLDVAKILNDLVKGKCKVIGERYGWFIVYE